MADNDMWTIKAALDWTIGFLERKGDENPRLSAEWLMSEATGPKGRSSIGLSTGSAVVPATAETFTGMQHKYVTPKKWPPVVFALADEDAFAYCDKNPCVQCTFRCKREFEIYAYVENIGMVVKHLDEWVAPGSASTDDFDSPTEIMEKARKAKAEKGE